MKEVTGFWIVVVSVRTEDEFYNLYATRSAKPELTKMDFPYVKDDPRGNIVFEDADEAQKVANFCKGVAVPVYFNANNALVIYGRRP